MGGGVLDVPWSIIFTSFLPRLTRATPLVGGHPVPSQHLFRSAARRARETNPEKPLAVSAGSDSLEEILKHPPPGTRREDFVSGAVVSDGAAGAWRRAVEDVFGPAGPAGRCRKPRRR